MIAPPAHPRKQKERAAEEERANMGTVALLIGPRRAPTGITEQIPTALCG